MNNLFAALLLLATINLFGQSDISYSWKNVPIGGGGYIIGMQMHPQNNEVFYFRTDIGGAYKWNAVEEEMEQLFHFGQEKENYYGAAGIALVESDEDVVAFAVDRKCKTNGESAILYSNDQGETFTEYPMPIYFGSNGGRDCLSGGDKDRQGSPLVFNPLNPTELYIGTRGEGLWKYQIGNPNPSRVAGNVILDDASLASIRSVKFHPTHKENIAVGYAEHGIYLGSSINNVFVEISAGINDLLSVADMCFSEDGKYLYVACRKNGIYRCTDPLSNNRLWEKVLNYTGTDPDGDGFLTVSASPHDSKTVVSVFGDYNALNSFTVSQDYGTSNSWVNHPVDEISNIFSWRDGPFGSHISQLVFDVQNPYRLYYSSWFTTFKTDNYLAPTVRWDNERAKGHEETVTTEIIPIPKTNEGKFIIHMGADDSGYIEDDISDENYPNYTIRDVLNNSTDMVKGATAAVCESNPQNIIACLTKDWDNSTGDLAISNDGGQSFTRSTNYPDSYGKSELAVSSTDPLKVVIANKMGIQFSSDGGNSFLPATGTGLVDDCMAGSFTCLGNTTVTDQAINFNVFSVSRFLAADKSIACLFYYYDWNDGSFNVSTDYGQNWCIVSTGLPTYNNGNGTFNEWKNKTRVTTIPGYPKHVWINFNSGLYFSDDAGVSWALQANIQNASLFGFGANLAQNSYPALYLYGKANNDSEYRYYRSFDMGQSWQTINDPSLGENWGGPKILAGDRNVPGRVYVGTGGLGLVHADAPSFSQIASVPEIMPNECCEMPLDVWESSGLVVSNYNEFWTHNDADNNTNIFKVDSLCAVQRTITLDNCHNFDWEDMCQDRDGNIYIGEVGSKNKAYSSNNIYDSLYLYKIGDPDFNCETNMTPEPILFSFPSQPKSVADCESMFAYKDSIYLINKNYNGTLAWGGRALLFRVPNLGNQPLYSADFVDSISIHEYPLLPIDSITITAADLAPDDNTLVLLAYTRLYVLYNFTPGKFFDGEMKRFKFPSWRQREGVAFADNTTLYITDEDKSTNNHTTNGKGHLSKIDLCELVPDLPACDCKSKVAQDYVTTYQELVEESVDGSISNGSSDIELVYDNAATGNQHVGMRFNNLSVPRGATILSAHLQFTVDETDNQNPNNLTIWGEATGNSPVFSAQVPFDVSSRPKTNQTISWSFDNWNTVGEATRTQRTPDISGIIQEIVNQSTWSANNYLGLIITGSGNRTAEARSTCSNSAPFLQIEYCVNAPIDCPDVLFVDESPIRSGTYHTDQYTGSDSKVLLNDNVQLKSGIEVELKSGFNVEVGGYFLGDIESCLPQ